MTPCSYWIIQPQSDLLHAKRDQIAMKSYIAHNCGVDLITVMFLNYRIKYLRKVPLYGHFECTNGNLRNQTCIGLIVKLYLNNHYCICK